MVLRSRLSIRSCWIPQLGLRRRSRMRMDHQLSLKMCQMPSEWRLMYVTLLIVGKSASLPAPNRWGMVGCINLNQKIIENHILVWVSPFPRRKKRSLSHLETAQLIDSPKASAILGSTEGWLLWWQRYYHCGPFAVPVDFLLWKWKVDKEAVKSGGEFCNFYVFFVFRCKSGQMSGTYLGQHCGCYLYMLICKHFLLKKLSYPAHI